MSRLSLIPPVDRTAARAKGVPLRFPNGGTLPAYLHIHEGALVQILVNLVGNAVKFTDNGPITVSTHYDDNLQILAIDVEDTGRGFDAVTRDSLFHRFSRGNDVSDVPSGAGLGLSICKALVETLDGNIDVTSAPGVGSHFRISLPARQRAAHLLRALQSPGRERPARRRSSSGSRGDGALPQGCGGIRQKIAHRLCYWRKRTRSTSFSGPGCLLWRRDNRPARHYG
ncbi:MAG: ATP-binding protein [Alphaproteobacteria bacterium]|nr:MAG: ATP-binding protein [Alphaproteobacteria bacterium]